MADTDNNNKEAADQASDSEEVISLEDLDSMLEEVDPSFSEEMKEIGANTELNEAQIEDVPTAEISEEVEERQTKLELLFEKFPFLKKIEAPLEKIKKKFYLRWVKFKNIITYWASSTIVFFTKTLPKLLKDFKNDYNKYIKIISEKHKAIKAKLDSYPKRTKIGMALVLPFFASLFLAVSYTLTERWLPEMSEPVIKRIDSFADKEFIFSRDNDMKAFYRSFPQPKHIVWIDKVVVNLRRTSAHKNPMAAYDFYFDTDSQETAIEVKDRKKQILDVVQRTLEEFTFEDLRNAFGNARLRADVRKEINSILNQGRVEEVYIKNKVLKP